MWPFKIKKQENVLLTTNAQLIADLDNLERKIKKDELALKERESWLKLKELQYELKLSKEINEKIKEYKERNAELKIALEIAESRAHRYSEELSGAKESVNNLLRLYVDLVSKIKLNETSVKGEDSV